MSQKSFTADAGLNMIKIFLDTNVLVSATFWKGSAYILRDFNATEEKADEYIQKLLEFLEVVSPTEYFDIIKNDPSDNKILAGAVKSKSDFIVSYDRKHVLALKNFKGICIVTPEEVLEKI